VARSGGTKVVLRWYCACCGALCMLTRPRRNTRQIVQRCSRTGPLRPPNHCTPARPSRRPSELYIFRRVPSLLGLGIRRNRTTSAREKMLHPFSRIVNRTETSRILCKPTAADQNLAASASRSLPRSTYPRIRRHIDFGTRPYSWEMRSVLFPDSRRSHQEHNGREFPSRRDVLAMEARSTRSLGKRCRRGCQLKRGAFYGFIDSWSEVGLHPLCHRVGLFLSNR